MAILPGEAAVEGRWSGNPANWKPEISRVCAAAAEERLIELQRLLFGFRLNRRDQLRVIVARCVDPLADSMCAHQLDGYAGTSSLPCSLAQLLPCLIDLQFNQEETPLIKASIFSAAAATIAAATLTGAAYAQPATNASDGRPVKNVVLVHGAFADGSGWRGVYDELTSRGYRVTIVQNPLTSLADDVAATNRALARQDGPTILVGHSWGGTVITEAGIDPKVAALVYVSALSPDAGETTSDQYTGFTSPPEFVIDTLPDGFGIVRPENFKAGFAADTSDADAAFLRDSQVPINMSVFGTKLKNAAWRTKPSWAVIATDDKAFDQRMLQTMAKRIGASITEVKASHAVFMTQPKAVADVIDQAARNAVRAAR